MKLMKHLFSSLFIAGVMLSTQAIAEEKTAEQAQPQTQVQMVRKPMRKIVKNYWQN